MDLNENEVTSTSYDKAENRASQKAKKRQKKAAKRRSAYERKTITLLSGVLVVGICLLSVSLMGMMSVSTGSLNSAANGGGVAQNQNNVNSGNGQASNTPDSNAYQNQISVEDIPVFEGTTPQTDEEWLMFFNTAVNKLKSEAPAMKKAKQTQTVDIQLSNPLGNTVVEAQKDKYLSNKVVETQIAKGDKNAAQMNVSPDGESYVSALTMADIKGISYSTDASGNYVINITMNDVTNPDLNSSYAKIFEFMLVDDVMDTYAPDMGATVDRSNVELKYSNCYASATITPDGKVVSFHTTVNANMILKDAKVKIITTDLDATLFSDTNYTDIVW